jgi:hypothetical protein
MVPARDWLINVSLPPESDIECVFSDCPLWARSGHGSPSNPNIIFGCTVATFMTRIEYASRLDQQQLNFMLGIRLVLDALWDNKHLACRNADCPHPENRSSECLLGQ